MVSKKALIVDDSKLALFVLKKMLVGLGLNVETTQSAEEALGYLVHNRPDVVFLDYTMPGMDGLQALRIMKENPETAPIPVLMYTSKDDNVFVGQAIELGAVEVLPKQLKPSQLLKSLQKMHMLPTAEEDLAEEGMSVSQQDNSESYDVLMSEKEELAGLVKDAESALEKESLKQYVGQEFERHYLRHKALIRQIGRRFDTALENFTDHTNSPVNIFNFLRICLVLIGFGVISSFFWSLHGDMRQMKEQVVALREEEEERAFDMFAEMAVNDDSDRRIDGLLYALTAQANEQSQVPYGKPMLGDLVAQQILAWMLPLNEARYVGVLELRVHTGRFCLTAKDSGEFVLPEPDTAVSECQVSDYIFDLDSDDNALLVRLVNEINRDANNTYKISIVSDAEDPNMIDYPGLDADVTAGDWNQVAQQNHRIEYVFR